MYNPEAKDLDIHREYSPHAFALFSRYEFSPLESCIEQVNNITAQHRKILFKSGVQCQYLRYGGVNDNRLVDIFYKEGDDCKPSPLFVFIHGGYWRFGDKDLSTSMVGPLVKNGYRVAVVDYNLCPKVNLPELMEEFCGFATWIFQYADRTQTTDITFAGHGSGAHLLAQLLHIPGCIPDCNRAKVKSMFFLTGIYDLREVWLLVHINQYNSFKLDEQKAVDVSPILWSWKEEAEKWACLQIHVLTVEHESVTFQEQSRQFSIILENAGFNSTFKQLEGLDHFTIILEQIEERNEITKYIKTAMQKASSGSSRGSNRPCTCATKP